MSFIPGFDYDIFISYAHRDNEKMFDKGWVEYFYKSLDSFLSERTGKVGAIKIWWDSKRLDGSTLFDRSIEQGLEKSAIMISLVSKYYLESDYCKLEMEHFSRKISSDNIGSAVGNKSRMVHVLLQNIPFDEWPSHFAGRTGFPFYIAPDAAKLGDTIKTNSEAFPSNMGLLRDSIEDLLNEFKKRNSDSSEKITIPVEKKSTETDGLTIYFSSVVESFYSLRKRTITEIESKGYNVLTVNPINNIDDHSIAVKEAISKADLCVHLLDDSPGKEITEHGNVWYPTLEAELAIQSGKPVIIWTAPMDTNDIDEPVYRTFLENLDNGHLSSDSVEVIHDHKAMISQHVTDKADQLKSIKQAKIIRQQSSATEDRTQVLIDTSFEDQIPAWDLGRALLENGIQPLVNSGHKDPVHNINELADRMSQAQKLVFYYGNADKEWIRQRMNAALHTAMDKDIPIDNFFVYAAPPDKNPQEILPKQKFIKVNLIDSSKKPGNEAMYELVKQLKGESI